MIRIRIMTILLSLFFPLNSQAERWVIATLEWPPFVCSRCPENGAGAKALRDAMKKVDVDVEFVFSSWTRAIEDVRRNRALAFYPSWLETIAQRPEFVMSVPFFSSPVGFVELKEKPLEWKTLIDLKGKTIGIAEDYGNTAEFNSLVDQGLIKTSSVLSDDINIRRVAEGKINAAIVDVNIALFYLHYSSSPLARKVQLNKKFIEDKALYLGFKKSRAAKAAKVARALEKTDTQAIVRLYLKKYYPFLSHQK